MNKIFNKISFRLLFTLPVILIIVVSIYSTSYLSYINGKDEVDKLIKELHVQVSDKIIQHLNMLFSEPVLLNEINLNAIKQKQIDLDNIDNLKEHFIPQIKIFKQIVSHGFASEKKDFISSAGNSNKIKYGYAISSEKTRFSLELYSESNNENLEKIASYPNYDPRIRPWYKKAKEEGKKLWTDVYVYTTGDPGIDSVIPIYKENKFLGVLFASMTLNSITDFIKNISISENGKIFITDKKGLLIASSTENNYNKIKNKLLYIDKDGEESIKEANKFLIDKFGSISNISDLYYEFDISGEKQLTRVSSYKDKYGLDLLIFTIIPEKDFMKGIYESNKNTIFLIIISSLGSIIVITFVIFLITTPLIKLKNSAKAIAKGDLSKRVEVFRFDEIGDLADSFNNMADQLQASFNSLKQSNDELELRVKSRTKELESANQDLFEEINLRKKIETQIIIEKNTAEQYLEISEAIIVKLDLKGNILLINNHGCKTLSYKEDELIGKNWFEIVIPKDNKDKIYNDFLQDLKSNSNDIKYYDYKIISKDNKVFYFTWNRSFLRDKEGKVIGTISSGRDITELKNTQTRMVESEKMASLGVLTAGIAHEINNPINFINVSTKSINSVLSDIMEILKEYNSINESNFIQKIKEIEENKKNIDFDDLIEGIKELSSNIELGVKRVSEIIKGLNIFSRYDDEEKSECNINENIDLALLLIQSETNKKIKITKNYEDLPIIYVYQSKLNQLFINILSNAIDSIKNKQQITENEEIIIKTSLINNKEIKVSISDTGEGISEEVMSHIFEPFYTTKKVGKGTGLGLAIVMGIINNHDGKISVESKIGIGTTFSIIIPIKTNT